jgi:RHS repeat-associated protein
VFRWQGWRDGVLEVEDRYAWDELSNMINDADGDSFTYNAERSRLLSAQVDGDSHTYTYDDAGFLTTRDGLQMSWTATGRLSRVGPAGNPIAQIQWDMAGQVIAASVAGETRTFSLFGGDVEYDAVTQGVGELHLGHVSIPFVGNARRYRHLDSRGNVSFTSDDAGAITSHRRYRPFGMDTVYGDDDFVEGEPRGFQRGVELRHNGFTTGLVVLDARILDSDIGRFLSPDPVFQLSNQYTYALGNPVFYADSSGGTPVGVDLNAVIAETEALAAEFDAMAAKANATAAKLAAAAVAAGAIGLVYPPALKVAAVLAVASALATANAAEFSAQAAGLGAAAAALKLAQTSVESGGRLPPPPPPQGKELTLTPAPDGADDGGDGPDIGSPPIQIPDIRVCGPSETGGDRRMTAIWICVAVIVLLASLIVSQRRTPRDLLRADPALTPSYRLTRWVGSGLVFVAVIQLMHWLWWGVRYSTWSQDWMIAIALALTGVAIVWRLSARRGAASIH